MDNFQLEENKNLLAGETCKFCIKQIYEKTEKLEYISECDSAYTISVLKRENFSELFDKIDKKWSYVKI